MIYGSVASGAHAEMIAFERELGWRCAFTSEIDKHASAVIRYHADSPNMGDFTTIGADESTRIDLLCGGTPCQDFSVAGLRAGLTGERGNLTLEFVRLARRLKPTWILWENVPGVMSSDEGRALGAFLGGLAELGYGFGYRVLDAQHFGVPQRRRRIFVVGYSGDWRPAAAVLFEPESLQGHPAPGREAGERTADSLTVGANQYSGFPGEPVEAMWWNGNDVSDTLQATSDSQMMPDKGRFQAVISPTVTAKWAKGSGGPSGSETGNLVAFTNRGTDTGNSSETMRSASHGAIPMVAFSCKDHGSDAGDVAPTLRSMAHDKSHVNGGGQVAVAFGHGQHTTGFQGDRVYGEGDAWGALSAGGGNNGGGAGGLLLQPMQVRRLTPKECERLQGWPDDWTRYGKDESGKVYEISDTQRYRMIGNGWALPVVRWIAGRIQMVQELIDERIAA